MKASDAVNDIRRRVMEKPDADIRNEFAELCEIVNMLFGLLEEQNRAKATTP